jgi:septum formation protein
MPETAFIQRPRLVLASASPRRKALLASVGVDVQVEPADIDETPLPGERPEALVRRLSVAKAEAIAVAKNDMVIGADTVVVVDDQILGKPIDEDDARRMLELLSGRTHRVLTGVSVRGGDRTETEVESAEVTMRFLSVADIAWYIGTGEPMGKAGAYAIQGFGSLFVPEIVGNHSGIVGLPLPMVDALLARFGRPLPTWLPRG